MPPNTEFQLGQLTSSVKTLSDAIAAMSITIKSLDDRLRANESQTLRQSIYFGGIGVVAGGIGSFAMAVFLKFL